MGCPTQNSQTPDGNLSATGRLAIQILEISGISGLWICGWICGETEPSCPIRSYFVRVLLDACFGSAAARGFKEILEGKYDDIPEANFYMKGPIEEIKQS